MPFQMDQNETLQMLLSLSEDIAAIRDRDTLFDLIINQIRPLFGFNQYANIGVLDSTGQNLSMFFTQMNDEEQQGSLVPTFQHFPVVGVFVPILATEQVVIIDESWKTSPKDNPIDEASAQIWRDNDFKYSLSVSLRTMNRVVGSFHVHFYEHRQFTANQLRFFKAVSNQLAVAVANILANEEILERERKSAALLAISESFALIRDKEQLLTAVFGQLHTLFNFYDGGLFVIDADQSHITDWTVTLPLISPSAVNQALHNSELGRTPYPGSALERGAVWPLRDAGGPRLFRYDRALLEQFPEFVQFDLMKQYGIAESLGALLRTPQGELGILFINSQRTGQLDAVSLPLFQAIANQTAVAVANIIANEAIQAEIARTDLLISIANAMATINDKQHLLATIVKELQPVFGFYDIGLLILSPNQQFAHDWAVLYPAINPSAVNQRLHDDQLGRLNYPGSLIEWAIAQVDQAGQPMVFAIDQKLVQRWPELAVLTVELEAGFQECLFTTLRAGGRLLGSLNFNSLVSGHFKPADFSLFQAVADQVAIGVAGIIAHEEIVAREREKTVLLSLSEDMATIRDRNDLWRVMMEKIRPLVAFEDAVLVTLDADLKRYTSVLTVSPEERQAHALFHEVVRDKPISDSPVWWYLDQKSSFIIQDLTALATDPTFPNHDPAVVLMKETGLWMSLIHKLHWGDNLVGLLFFHYTSNQQVSPTLKSLTKTIADQVAVAVANIVANEAILQREQEKALQVALTQALIEENTWPDKWLQVGRLLQPSYPFDLLSFTWTDAAAQSQFYALRPIGADEYQPIDTAALWRMSRTTATEWAALTNTPLEPSAERLTGEDFIRACQLDPLKALLARTFGLSSALTVPLGTPQGFQMRLLSRQPNAFTTEQLARLGQLAPVLTLILERLVAYQSVKQLRDQLEAEKHYLLTEIKTTHNFEQIIGTSAVLHQAFRQVSLVAPTEASVLLAGETGTGKELFARALHQASLRHHKLLIKLNCAALPASLIESELFGHERGSFTGAIAQRIGKFELAHGSTLFLDEIGELPLDVQAKLLRVLQEKEFERVGGNKVIRADVRIIAATNRNLLGEVNAGRFRSDLYYRLNVFPITLPALRERREDIPLLAGHFVTRYAKRVGRPVRGFSNGAMAQLLSYNWPGNIRELEHLVERSIILSDGVLIDRLDLPAVIIPAVTTGADLRIQTLQETERTHILKALHQSEGRIRGQGGAAILLGLPPTTLESKMKKLSLKRSDSR